MHSALKPFWILYILFVWLPLGVSATIITAVVTIVGCMFGDDKIWGYYPGMLWSRFLCILSWNRVEIKGQSNIRKGQSYIFCSNHTSIYDVFLIYGFIGVPFKWIMKQELAGVPFIGRACKAAGFLFINRKKGRQAFNTLQQAKNVFKGGVSLVIFPEGTRTRDGEIGKFKRGAFEIAREMGLPIIPLRIDGGFEVMPYNRLYPVPGKLTLTILPEIGTFAPVDHDAEIAEIEQIRQSIINA